ncbi:MAG: hypothetical protein ABFS12_09975 [Bacteroidota bacterium]
MGQQQLLLIVLGLILVGVAVFLGTALFTANAIEAKRNNIINDLLHLASEAQRYYKTPMAMGGGSRSFVGWEVPKGLKVNADGEFTIEATASADQVILIGTGNDIVQDNNAVQVKMTVIQDDYTTEIIH